MYEHKITYYFLQAMAALMVATGLTSCSEDEELMKDEDPVELKADEYHVSILINAGSSSTRAGGTEDELDDEYEDGVEDDVVNENYIDVNNLHFYLLDANDVNGPSGSSYLHVGFLNQDSTPLHFETKGIAAMGNDSYLLTATITKSTAEMLSNNEFRLMVTANFTPVIHNPIQTAAYWFMWLESKFDYEEMMTNGYYLPTKDHPFPMFGIKYYTTEVKSQGKMNFEKGKLTNLGTIQLLRAFAKIEVMRDPSDTQSEISNVKLASCLKSYKAIPRDMFQNTEIPTDCNQNMPGDDSSGSAYYDPSGKDKKLTNLPFYKREDNHYVIYIPEYRLVNVTQKYTNGVYNTITDSSNKITLTLNGAEREIEFRDYNELNNEGITSISQCTQFNILRNHIYRFYVTSAPSIQYMVESWDKYTADTIEFN